MVVQNIRVDTGEPEVVETICIDLTDQSVATHFESLTWVPWAPVMVPGQGTPATPGVSSVEEESDSSDSEQWLGPQNAPSAPTTVPPSPVVVWMGDDIENIGDTNNMS